MEWIASLKELGLNGIFAGGVMFILWQLLKIAARIIEREQEMRLEVSKAEIDNFKAQTEALRALKTSMEANFAEVHTRMRALTEKRNIRRLISNRNGQS